MSSTEDTDLINQILPLLVTQPSSLAKHEVVAIIKAIVKCEKQILNMTNDNAADAESVAFFSPVVALTGHCIMTYANQIPKSLLPLASKVCGIILQYLLHAVTNYEENSTLSKQQLVSLIQGLCEDIPPLLKSDIMSLCSVLKSAKLPAVFLVKPELQSEQKSLSGAAGMTREEASKESKRIRMDHSCEAIIEQLMTPIVEHSNKKEAVDQEKAPILGAYGHDTKSLLISKNLLTLQQLGGANILLEFIMTLSSLEQYIQLVLATEEGAPLKLPGNANDASVVIRSCKPLLKDYDIVWRILSLPILEPLTEDRLSKVITIIHACIYVSLTLTCSSSLNVYSGQSMKSSAASATAKEEDGEIGIVNDIVDTSLEIYKRIILVMKNSIRVGGQICQNVHLFASWLLLSGLKYIMKSSTGTTLNVPPGKEIVVKKHGYNQLCISLASHAVQLLSSLFDDLKSEMSLGTFQKLSAEKLANISHSSSFKYNKFGYYSAWQRIEMLMSNINITNLLFSLASMSYRRAGLLKLVSRTGSSEADAHSGASATSGRDFDDESCFSSDDSSRDDDSEPILGQLFKEQEENRDNNEKASKNRQMMEAICQDKREPQRHLTLAMNTLELLNTYFVCSEIESLRQYFKLTVGETQITILGHIIKDLDREFSYNQHFYSDFSRVLSLFMHNVIATEVLSDQLQTYLLTCLGVNPDSSPDTIWPLNVPTRTLSVLSQIILMKQQKEKNELKSDCSSLCLTIWNSLMNHIKKLILNDEPLTDLEDINVEHAQLLLFIFHNLKLLQRKPVLLAIAKTINEVSSVVRKPMRDHQIHFLGRLLHFFEYILKNLYDAPIYLVEQIENNLFKTSSILTTPKRDKDNNNITCDTALTRMYFSCRDLEENYQKEADNKVFSTAIKPKFFYLLNIETSNLKEVPKLDGMALNFILVGLQEVLLYDDLYDSILQLLLVGNQYDIKKRNFNENLKLGHLGFHSLHYTFNAAWRLILQLPPSTKILNAISSGDVQVLTREIALHSAIWSPRINHSKWFIWLKDWLSKLLHSEPNTKPEVFLKNVGQISGSMSFNVQLLRHLLNQQFSLIKYDPTTDKVMNEGMPLFFDLFLLDVLLSRFLVLIDSFTNQNEGINLEVKQAAIELLPTVLNLVTVNLSAARWLLIGQMVEDDAQQGIATVPKLLNAYNSILKITSMKCNLKLSNFTSTLSSYLPRNLLKNLDKWNVIQVDTNNWRTEHGTLPIPSESLIFLIQNQHFSSLMTNPKINILTAVKYFINTLLKTAEELFRLSENKYTKDFVRVMLPLQMDSVCESFVNYGSSYLETTFGPKDSDDYLINLYIEALTHAYDLLINYSDKECCVEEKILLECLKYMEGLLDTIAGQAALERFFCEDDTKDIVSFLMSASNDNLSSAYSTRVLKFFSKLFQQTDKNPDTISLVRLCTSLSKLSIYSKPDSNNTVLQTWLTKILCERLESTQTIIANQENRILLQNLTSYIVKENSAVDEQVASAFLYALIPMGTQILSSTPEILGFSELMMIMVTLAGAGSGIGHLDLLKSSVNWLETCKKYLSKKDVIEKLEKNITSGRHQVILESTCFILSYVADILDAMLVLTDSKRPGSPDDFAVGPGEEPDPLDELALPDEDESPVEESDEESLCNKLCTFAMTQKEFMNQHWYHCHTCKMIDGVGACTICAKVCHKDHDVTYSKYGSFFCDCGAKEDGTCQALVRRTPNADQNYSKDYAAPGHVSGLHSSFRRRPSSPDKTHSQSQEKSSCETGQSKHQLLAKQLEPNKSEILNILSEANVSSTVISLMKFLSPSMVSNCLKNSSIGSSIRAKKALEDLHQLEKSLLISDQLMVPTLGSQEGAFENVKMTYTGEQGQQIRQLISTHVLRRVAMCALTGLYGQGKRQHLAVSHEKGKITLLQLGTLLKQADTSKKKLTLTRLASAPLPFTAISITGNPCNEDYLAVCGLKDCHVLTFTTTGLVHSHLVLHPQLDAGNYIIKALWLPGTQTQLAIVTSDFVKIYDLGVDVVSPQFYFLLPSGKIRDITFVFSDDGQRNVLLISSAGHIYCQLMNEESSARNGPFYVTTLLDVQSEEMTDLNNHINGGGVSIYYSHTFQLLFFSYNNGKNFAAPLTSANQEVNVLYSIEIQSSSNGASSNGSSSKTSSSGLQALCQWTEVSGHPGLILAMCLTNNNPVVLMIKPDSFVIQEIKFLNMKAKITDMVALRHATGAGDMRTTLILLCEDGSLRIYMASQEATNYWLRPTICTEQFLSQLPVAKSIRKRPKSSKTFRSIPAAQATSGPASVQFPVDFFEHCTLMTDVDFGGTDILQIYNTQQVKNRLNTTGMYIACTKPVGFTIEITNNDNSMVMVGIRVLLGNQDLGRAPAYIDVFGRQIHVYLTRNRWYDIPFTREESLTSDKKLNVFFASSSDPNGITMVDSIKVYGKTKENFNWPEDASETEYANQNILGASGASTSSPDMDNFQQPLQALSPLDRLLSWSLDVLNGSFNLEVIPKGDDGQVQRKICLDISTRLLTLPYSSLVQNNIKSLIFTLHRNRSEYNNHRDESVLKYVISTLKDAISNDTLDGELFFRLLLMTRQIANDRPQNLIQFTEYQNVFDDEKPKEECKLIELKTFDNQMKAKLEKSPTEDKKPLNSSYLDAPVPPARSASVTFSDEVDIRKISSHDGSASFIIYLSDIFWRLYHLRPPNPLLTSIAKSGVVHVEETVQALVEVIHAFSLSNMSNVDIACQLYLKLLLCEDTAISFGAKQSLVRVLRPRSRKHKVHVSSPPQCDTPGLDREQKELMSQSASLTESQHSDHHSGRLEDSALEIFGHDNMLQQEQEQQFEMIDALEQEDAAVGGVEGLIVAPDDGFSPLLDLGNSDGDVDDEAMVELAIALSLQDQQHQPSGSIPPQVPMPSAAVTPQRSASLEDRGHYSDTTASAAASDDEGSTAATDGSTLRTSPANELHGNEGGSESGGSGPESIIGETSARNSVYGEELNTTSKQRLASEETEENESDMSMNVKLHNLRLVLLEHLIGSLDQVRDVGGVRSIPLMQVILMLSSDLDGEGERDKQVLLLLLNTLLTELYANTKDISVLVHRTANHEVKLIIMRLLSILMSRARSSSSSSRSMPPEMGAESSAFVSTITATTLINSTIIDFCLQILIHLLDYWKNWQNEEISTMSGTSALLKAHLLHPPPEMSPFFLKQYVRGHADDVFEVYPQLLTEMILRMPYQIKKISNSLSVATKQTVTFPQIWCDYLCEYMMNNLTSYIRKQVRKLLSYICGSKERYRQLRDFHSLDSHLKEIKKICRSGGFQDYLGGGALNGAITLSYDATISLIEHLKACSEIATNRTSNWQRCCQKDQNILPFFIHAACLLDEGVSPIVLQLLQYALCPVNANAPSSSNSGSKQNSNKLTVPESEESEPLYVHLAQQLLKQVDTKLLSQFIQTFLLESNSTSHRWAAHSLVYNLYKSFPPYQQEQLLDLLWSLWFKLPSYGRKAAQFVDLLGYFTLKITCNEEKERDFAEKALLVLRQQNQQLMHHPNCNLYNSLQSLVEFDGYYLESEPCLVCNNPEVNYSNMKLSSIKVDSRFTTTTQIVKLVGSHTISKITLRISDIKRAKMVKTLNILYNNRAVHSVVELKSKTAVWHKAKRCVLSAGQSELKIDFPLPIVACNLMIEYCDFYENFQASTETLQCPRCSASVPANPGVCSNCGENVFQCHKCRAINYDEKDPFLCNSCGFCKYAKFDLTLTAKPTCAVDSIENEEDRKKTVTSINSLLEKADRVYKNLIANKPALEVLLLRIQEHGMFDKFDDTSFLGAQNMANVQGSASAVHVNRAIQQVAQRYCQDCKSSFDELSKIIQKVLASRKELVDYDNRQRERNSSSFPKSSLHTRRDSKVLSTPTSSVSCYGCASSTVEHCITLLKALAMLPKYRSLLCSYGLLRELVEYNLRNGSNIVRQEVRQLLCLLTKDNHRATADLNNLLMDKISVALKSRSGASLDLSSSVRHEIALLATSMDKEDSCWEQRLRCIMQLFLMGLQIESPAVLESITLPCLKLLQSLIKPEPLISKKNRDKSIDQLSTVKTNGFNIGVDLNKWLAGDPRHCFKSWKIRSAKRSTTLSIEEQKKIIGKTKADVRLYYLQEKYGLKWREKVQKHQKLSLTLLRDSWLRTILFNGASRSVRLMACSLIEALFQIPSRKKEIIDLLTLYLDDLGQAGEFGVEFYSFYLNMIQDVHWKYYLALHGLLPHLGSLITKEIEYLNQLEETTLNSDLSQGCALKMLVELLTSLLGVEAIGRQYKSKMVGFVLNGYLSLRKLVVQRTKVIDETQEALLELLEEMTTGNESETAAFMAVCLDAVTKCKTDDLRTPVFIFERLCSIIYPEENDTSEFFITLEKDPQQDDFLQGRMLGNPYSSNEPGMGPLMRDIKNKICQDCELVALLEDDSGLELLVNNKIISLDLPVKEVWKKIWINDRHNGDSNDSMKIIYRIRGLMGDATEEFIESLDLKDNKEVDNEQVYKMANVMSRCGGIEVMLSRLELVTDLSPRVRHLMMVLLKLFGHCVKVKSNRQKLIDPNLNAIGIMLNILKLLLKSEALDLILTPATPGQGSPLEQLAQIMETILIEASNCSMKEFDKFCSATCGTTEDISLLLTLATSSSLVKSNPNLMQLLMRIIALLTMGNSMKMKTMLNFFKPYLKFNKFDFDHTNEDDHHLELFCQLANGIERNDNGNRLKDLIVEEGIVQSALEYLVLHAPPMKTSLLATSEEWKEFTSRPALKYVLRFLTGLSFSHETTQLMVSKDAILIIHGLEQVASDAHVGSLAENLMEVIKQHPSVQEKIEEVRRQTKDEKKKMAMAVREKHLNELRMKTNEKGQVTAKCDLFKQVEDLGEETGLVCIICREGYKFHSNKVLGIYTFTKRCNVEEYELKPRKTLGYSTVTHFNVVHVDCHMSAVRVARGRDEWESAALQNANTRCNGLLPLWGPHVQESAFASCLARHNTYLQECTGHRDVNYVSTIHDLKLLLLRFAGEKSFSDDSGGGGPQSNMHLVPYLIHMALYVINTYKAAQSLNKKITNFLEMPSNKWIENCFEAEGPTYWCLMSLLINPPNVWKKHRLAYLRKLIICAHVRHKRTSSAASGQAAALPTLASLLTNQVVKPEDYSVYKQMLIYFALVDLLYHEMFKNVACSSDDHWPLAMADYIRNNDQMLLDSGDKILRFYEENLLPCQSFAEFCDVAELLEDIPAPDSYFAAALKLT